MAVGALEIKFWQRLCEILGKPEYGPEQFNTEKTDEIFAWLKDKFKDKTRAEWMEVFADEDACVSPVLSITEMASDPQVLRREMVVEVEDEKLGRTKTLGIPVKFGATPGEIRRSAPRLGEHTTEVLEMLGCSSENIVQLKADGVVC
jgi:crotonobetainyl-CoA:carnitine CoA-transferase CaiB-like acyl-CoA transferase